MDERTRKSDNRPMTRARRNPFTRPSTCQHYIVMWDLHWRVIDCRRLARGSGLSEALKETIERLELDGWRAEGRAEFGFTFVTRPGERRLVMITGRDPFDAAIQTFSPFGGSCGEQRSKSIYWTLGKDHD
jgi:hypothetical protein